MIYPSYRMVCVMFYARSCFIMSVCCYLVHSHQRQVDQKAHSMPSTSANTYWQIEKEKDSRSGTCRHMTMYYSSDI